MPSQIIACLVWALLGPAGATPTNDEVSLLQTHVGMRAPSRPIADMDAPAAGAQGLAFVHIPANFAHTVENVAMLGSGFFSSASKLAHVLSLSGLGKASWGSSWRQVRSLAQAGGEVWGRASPDLQATSDVTGCPLYSTPPKHWPKELAARYFGNRTVFGLLRDPYERLVALARDGERMGSCDVNGAVKQMMRDVIAGRHSRLSCLLVPQAEYFDGPHGIALPVDGREFPASVNEVYRQRGYPRLQIGRPDLVQVHGCPNAWPGDLDPETKSLVRQVYGRDFEVLCQHFGYCDREENSCAYQVPGVCPSWLIKAGYRGRPLQLVQAAAEATDAGEVDAQEEDFSRFMASGALGEDVQRLAANRTLVRRLLQMVAAP